MPIFFHMQLLQYIALLKKKSMREGGSVGVLKLFLKTFQASLAHVENFWFSLERSKVEKFCNKFNFLPSATVH